MQQMLYASIKGRTCKPFNPSSNVALPRSLELFHVTAFALSYVEITFVVLLGRAEVLHTVINHGDDRVSKTTEVIGFSTRSLKSIRPISQVNHNHSLGYTLDHINHIV